MASVAGLLAFTVAVIFFTSLVSTRDVLNDQAAQIVAAESTRAATAASRYLLPAEQAAVITAGLVESGLAPGLGTPLDQHMLDILAHVPQLDGVFLGTTNGSFYFINRDVTYSPGGTRTKAITVAPEGRTVTLTWRDALGEVVAEESDPTDTYDPRTRPWYVGVSAETQSTWTDPYVFFSSGKPGVTTASPVLVDGQVVAVVGIDVQLNGITGFLRSLASSANTSAALVSGNQIVAILDGQAVTDIDAEDVRFRTVDDLDGYLLRGAFAEFAAGGSEVASETPGLGSVRFQSGDEPNHASFAPLPDVNLDWYVVVAAPESDFLRQIFDARQRILTSVALAGIFSIVVAALFARSLTKPMKELRLSARELREGHVGQPVQSRFMEIEETADALYAAHTELEDRVERRTKDLETEIGERREAELRAVAANKSKSEFLANVSHELRTPLTAVIGYANLLHGLAADLSPEEVAEHAGIIEDAGSHLLELINDILDLAKIEAGEMVLDEAPIELPKLVAEVDRLLRPRAAARGVKFSVQSDEDVIVLGDRRRIKQILLNLASNAVKFTQAGNSAGITVSTSDERVKIVVEDTGIGMDESEVARALEMFGQIASDQGKNDGTGIGLPLTQHLVDEHEGELNIVSEKGVGTTVTVVFPSHRTVLPEIASAN